MTTIGVSIPVPAPWGDQLQQHRRGYGDPLADAIPTHVTLLPPTEVAAEALPGIRRHLSRVASTTTPFPMMLRGTGTFRPVSPVVFVQVARGVSQCEVLEGQIRTGPLRRDLHFPYHPHVTVAHDVQPAQMDRAFDELAGFECSFEVGSFDLYVHGPDEVWRPVDTFSFGARADAQPETGHAGTGAGGHQTPPAPEWEI